jgi:hypothetical protein
MGKEHLKKLENAMKRYVLTVTAALTLLLAGCATTIRSDVTTFHQWPADLQDKTYVFEAPPAQDDTLELRSYQNLVRGELAKLGFHGAVRLLPAVPPRLLGRRLVQPVLRPVLGRHADV